MVYYPLIKEIHKNGQCKPYIIEFEKRYDFFHGFSNKYCELNNNEIVIYGEKTVDIYTINLK